MMKRRCKSILSFSRFHLQYFTRLRALALDHLHSSRTISTVIGQCHQLIHLDLTHCLFSSDDPSISDLFNTIWSLRNLVRCHIDIRFNRGMEAILPTVISTSLQSLTIESFYYGSEDLARLFQHTPYLSASSSSYSAMLVPMEVYDLLFHRLFGYDSTSMGHQRS